MLLLGKCSLTAIFVILWKTVSFYRYLLGQLEMKITFVCLYFCDIKNIFKEGKYQFLIF